MTIIDELVNIAKAEIGTCEPSGDDKYITVYNSLTGSKFGKTVAWCAIYVTWVMHKAGVKKTVVPYFANCDTGMNWFKKKNQFKKAKAYGGDYTPNTGDVIFFSSKYTEKDSDHVGIVTGVTGSTVHTIEGNTSDAVHERSYSLSSKYILGYGVPDYGVKTQAHTNATKGYQTHTVVKGDTLWELAKKYLGNGSRYREFMTLNSLTSNTIHAGLVLMIPGTNGTAVESAKTTSIYKVVKGDSLWSIAQKKLGDGRRYREIMTLSNITSTTIRAGQILTLPAK